MINNFFIPIAHAATTTIELPAGFASDIAGNAGAFFAQLSPTTVLVVGVLLATTLVVILINAFRR